MSQFLLIPLGVKTGLTSVALGLVRALEQSGRKPLYFKPVSNERDEVEGVDTGTRFAEALFHQQPPQPLSLAQMDTMLSTGQDDDLIESMVAQFNQLSRATHDAVVIEGLIPDSERNYLANKNAKIAASLNARVVLVADAENETPAQMAAQLYLAWQEYAAGQGEPGGFILNRYNSTQAVAEYVTELQAALSASHSPLQCFGVVPLAPEKSAVRMLDVARYLQAEVLRGSEHLAKRRVQEIVVAGRSATYMHDRFKPGALIIAPGDREDVMMATALKTLSGVPLAGLILSCGSVPSDKLQDIVAPALKDQVPVLLTELDTYQTAYTLSHQPTQVPFDDLERIDGMVNHVAEHIDIATVCQDLGKPAKLRMSPPAFRYHMMERARQAAKRIVLPEGNEPRTIAAAAICQSKGIAQCILLAKPAEVFEVAQAKGIAIPDTLEIVDPDTIRERYVEPMVALRKHKGLTPELAHKQLEDTVVLGTMMLATGEVDGLVSGAVHTTANTIRPALQLIKTAPGAALVSSVFFMLMPEQVLVYGDCAVNPEPSAEELADIAIQSADSAKAFGIEPKVAMISYSTGSSGSGAEVEKVKAATALAKAKRPDLLIDGPLQYDAASVPSVGQQKAPDSPVAGRATVFVFPDLNTGNTTYKAVQRSANVLSVGPMLQGLNKPVNDLSRGALVDDIVYTIAITAIQAVQMTEGVSV
ncbi:phosphate acetyltransferase [Snodgrassella sp. CFCC 13594]|uniref:phosphate acetyltransferase n=1 Tax=Snodgrassella sp. CFCC 13594 TaxID=1775559 RepID=UPI0008303BBB|nr:phosphate acetyltransferase [Snodgrassella sp. CFCC 13594]